MAVVHPRREVSLSTTRKSASTALHFYSMRAENLPITGSGADDLKAYTLVLQGCKSTPKSLTAVELTMFTLAPESTKNLHTTPFTFKQTKGALTFEAGTSNLNVYSSSELHKVSRSSNSASTRLTSCFFSFSWDYDVHGAAFLFGNFGPHVTFANSI